MIFLSDVIIVTDTVTVTVILILIVIVGFVVVRNCNISSGILSKDYPWKNTKHVYTQTFDVLFTTITEVIGALLHYHTR